MSSLNQTPTFTPANNNAQQDIHEWFSNVNTIISSKNQPPFIQFVPSEQVNHIPCENTAFIENRFCKSSNISSTKPSNLINEITESEKIKNNNQNIKNDNSDSLELKENKIFPHNLNSNFQKKISPIECNQKDIISPPANCIQNIDPIEELINSVLHNAELELNLEINEKLDYLNQSQIQVSSQILPSQLSQDLKKNQQIQEINENQVILTNNEKVLLEEIEDEQSNIPSMKAELCSEHNSASTSDSPQSQSQDNFKFTDNKHSANQIVSSSQTVSPNDINALGEISQKLDEILKDENVPRQASTQSSQSSFSSDSQANKNLISEIATADQFISAENYSQQQENLISPQSSDSSIVADAAVKAAIVNLDEPIQEARVQHERKPDIPLNDQWTLWFCERGQRVREPIKNYGDQNITVADVKTVDEVIKLQSQLKSPLNMAQNIQLMLFRFSTQPEWESNKQGCSWTIQFEQNPNGYAQLEEFWENLIYMCTGQNLSLNVIGIVLTRKAKVENMVEIWMRNFDTETNQNTITKLVPHLRRDVIQLIRTNFEQALQNPQSNSSNETFTLMKNRSAGQQQQQQKHSQN